MTPLKQLLQSPFARRLFQPFRGLGAITMYHRVLTEPTMQSGFAPNFHLGVDQHQFDLQIAHLAKNYRCEHLETLIAEPSPEYRVAVTFDDGHIDNFALALPILEKHQVPATFFISTAFMENPAVVWWYPLEALVAKNPQVVLKGESNQESWITESTAQKHRCFSQLADLIKAREPKAQTELLEKLLESNGMGTVSDHVTALSWDQVKKLANHPLITIGAHTQTHPVLAMIPQERLYDEITRSKHILEDRLGIEIRTFAYPFGELKHARQREYEFAKHSGFDLAVTTRFGHLYPKMLSSDRRWRLPRVAIDPFDTPEKLDWKLGGAGALAKTTQRFIYEHQPDSTNP